MSGIRMTGIAMAGIAGFFCWVGIAEGEPVFLIGEAYCHQQRTEAEKAEDAVALAEIAEVVQKRFGDGEDEKDESLPADESGALPEADSKQTCSIEHKEG